jgi:hypothetical protein
MKLVLAAAGAAIVLATAAPAPAAPACWRAVLNQGLMVAGRNPAWFERRPRYDVQPAEGARA